jgi:hypothetical protein
MPGCGVIDRGPDHMLDVVEQETVGHDAFVDRIDTADL